MPMQEAIFLEICSITALTSKNKITALTSRGKYE